MPNTQNKEPNAATSTKYINIVVSSLEKTLTIVANTHRRDYILNTMRTSYSAIDTYRQCPQKYKFQEIDRIKIPKNREAIFGTLIHNTLKFMFRRDPLFPTLNEIINYFRESWPAKETLKIPWSAEEGKIYFEEGVRMLKKFYEKNAPWNFTVVDLESHFAIPLEDKKGAVHILAGKIDRIDKLPDDTYEIIDYKTAKRMPSQAALDKDLQLSLYSLGLQERWPHLRAEDIKLSLYFLKHGEKLSTKITPAATSKTKEELLKTITEIQRKLSAKEEFEPRPGPLCDWCGYKPICPAWSHLYRNKTQNLNGKSPAEMNAIIKEYFEIKKTKQQNEARLTELQSAIKDYMDRQKITRVFGKEGIISKKNIQRYEYDWEKVKTILSPLGKWEEVLKADENKLSRVLTEIPEEARMFIEKTRTISREYTVFTSSTKKVIKPEEIDLEESL